MMTRRTFIVQSICVFAGVLCLSCTAFADEKVKDAEPTVPPRQAILEQAGLWPLPVERPNAHAVVAHRRSHSNYSVENVALETVPGCYCTGNLYRPLLRHDLGPAVLVVDDVDLNTRHASERQMLCAHLARMGVTVLACNTAWEKPDCKRSPAATAYGTCMEYGKSDRFSCLLERIDVKRIGVVAAEQPVIQTNRRSDHYFAVDKPVPLSPTARNAIYSTFRVICTCSRIRFMLTIFAQRREPEPQPLEND